MLEHDGELFTSVFEPSATDHAGYPKLRTEGSSNDKFIKMGPDVTLRMKQFPIPNLQFPPMNNPLCTDPELRSMPFAERKAIEVNVMVISPTEVQDDGTPSYRYCDYKAVFDGAEQDTSAPKGLTKPRIVGFVRAHLFDFRLTPYEGGTGGDNGTGENPNSGNPAGAVMSGKYKTFMEKGKVFVEEHKEWRECRRAAASCPRFPPFPTGCPINCGGGPSKPSIPNSTSYEKLNSFNCFEMPEWNFLSGCVNNPSDANFSQCQSQFALGLAENGFPQRPEIIAAGNACLPRKIPGCSLPDENPACWEAPNHFKPQFGCGGIRGRLSCGDARLTTPGSAALRRPSLVN